jgi:5-methylcytosine-specific restriction protein A
MLLRGPWSSEVGLADRIPDGITRTHLLAAIEALDRGVAHAFGRSTGYDVFHNGKRYPPKALVGLAGEKIAGSALGPNDFHGGLGTRCFRVLEMNGFDVITKDDTAPFPDEVGPDVVHLEGAVSTIQVNRFERDPAARRKCIAYYGAQCSVCEFDFYVAFGEIGRGFVHVHHILPISQIHGEYVVNPIADLRPVCPNCHAMLHRRQPPYSVEELRLMLSEDLA